MALPGAHLPLAGRGVLITRPVEQSAALARLIEGAGGRAIVFPAIEIADIEDRLTLDALIDRLEGFDLAIFVSPTAAARGLEAIKARRTLPHALAVAAIGSGSARELERQGVRSVIAPRAGADSEALLALPALSGLAGKRVVIFRGVGGREYLREALVARGAVVEYAQCYRRRRPQADAGPLVAACERGEIDAVVATSSEGLRNLCELLGAAGRAALAAAVLLVPHPRVAECARALGFCAVTVTGAGDQPILDALAGRFRPRR